MTNEEAIKHGEEQLEIFGGEHKEFIRCALDALKRERKKGRWIKHENLGSNGHSIWISYNCSECDNPENHKCRFCSFCGAKMEGATDGTTMDK